MLAYNLRKGLLMIWTEHSLKDLKKEKVRRVGGETPKEDGMGLDPKMTYKLFWSGPKCFWLCPKLDFSGLIFRIWTCPK